MSEHDRRDFVKGKLLIVGATGAVGSEVVRVLVDAGERVRAASRMPEHAREVLPPGTEVVPFDLERADTFTAALDGVDRVFLMAPPGDPASDRLAIPLIDVMAKSGVRNVVNLTALGVDVLPETSLYRIEKHLERSGMGWTHLRPNFFMQLFTRGSLQQGVRRGVIALPADDAETSFIDARDLSAVAAAVLRDPERHDRHGYALTGPEPLSYGVIAQHLSHLLGRPIEYRVLDEETARGVLAATGFTPAHVERLIGFYRVVRAGGCAPVTEAVGGILGRRPMSFEVFASQMVSAWQ